VSALEYLDRVRVVAYSHRLEPRHGSGACMCVTTLPSSRPLPSAGVRHGLPTVRDGSTLEDRFVELVGGRQLRGKARVVTHLLRLRLLVLKNFSPRSTLAARRRDLRRPTASGAARRHDRAPRAQRCACDHRPNRRGDGGLRPRARLGEGSLLASGIDQTLHRRDWSPFRFR
jgi:hypothetical protein